MSGHHHSVSLTENATHTPLKLFVLVADRMSGVPNQSVFEHRHIKMATLNLIEI